MPGGYGNIKGTDGNTFSSTNQPKRRKSGPEWKTVINGLLDKEDGYLIVNYAEEVDKDGNPTGNKFSKARIKLPDREAIILGLIRKAKRGDTRAVEVLMDRTEGKPKQQVEAILTPKEDERTEDELREAYEKVLEQEGIRAKSNKHSKAQKKRGKKNPS